MVFFLNRQQVIMATNIRITAGFLKLVQQHFHFHPTITNDDQPV